MKIFLTIMCVYTPISLVALLQDLGMASKLGTSPTPGGSTVILSIVIGWAVYIAMWRITKSKRADAALDVVRAEKLEAFRLKQQEERLAAEIKKVVEHSEDVEWAMSRVNYRISQGDFDRKDLMFYIDLYENLVVDARSEKEIKKLLLAVENSKTIQDLDKESIRLDVAEFKKRLS